MCVCVCEHVRVCLYMCGGEYAQVLLARSNLGTLSNLQTHTNYIIPYVSICMYTFNYQHIYQELLMQ